MNFKYCIEIEDRDLTVLYIMVEVMWTHNDLLLWESFTQEIGNLVARYCRGSAVLLLLCKTMRAACPPASADELIEATGVRRNRRGLGRMAKQSSLDEMGLDLDDDSEELNDEHCGVESGFGRDSSHWIFIVR